MPKLEKIGDITRATPRCARTLKESTKMGCHIFRRTPNEEEIFIQQTAYLISYMTPLFTVIGMEHVSTSMHALIS